MGPSLALVPLQQRAAPTFGRLKPAPSRALWVNTTCSSDSLEVGSSSIGGSLRARGLAMAIPLTRVTTPRVSITRQTKVRTPTRPRPRLKQPVINQPHREYPPEPKPARPRARPSHHRRTTIRQLPIRSRPHLRHPPLQRLRAVPPNLRVPRRTYQPARSRLTVAARALRRVALPPTKPRWVGHCWSQQAS